MLCLFSRVNYDRKATDVFPMVHINLLYYSLYSTSNSDLCSFLQLSIDIGTEVKYHNKMLDEMVSFTFGLLSPGKINALLPLRDVVTLGKITYLTQLNTLYLYILFGCKTRPHSFIFLRMTELHCRAQ